MSSNISIKDYAKMVLHAIIGWLIIVPAAMLVPKKKNVVFIGRDDGRFVDNVKYLFLFSEYQNSSFTKVFLSENKDVVKELQNKNINAIFHPSIESILTMLTSKIVIMDSYNWFRRMKAYCLFSAVKVQLWHGMGIKRIQKDNLIRKKNPVLKLFSKALMEYPRYDIVISTSERCTEMFFSKAFTAGRFLESGYPRNDILKSDLEVTDIPGLDKKVYDYALKKKSEGQPIVVYAPTYRDTGGDAFSDGILNLKYLSDCAVQNNFIFVIKSHFEVRYEIEEHKNILRYENSSEIYPLLRDTDLLITDYSSIFFDFLLVDKPVIFFPYDLEKYRKKDREMLFDYDWVTPGPKCTTQIDLHCQIIRCLSDKDDYTEKRHEIRDFIFKHNDGNSSARIFSFLEKNYL